jgi:hypothetical protein
VLPVSAIPELSLTATPPDGDNTSTALEGTTQSSTAGGLIEPAWTKLVLNKWREYFTSAWWGQGRMPS